MHRVSVGLLAGLCGLAGPGCFNPTANDETTSTTTTSSSSTTHATTAIPTTGAPPATTGETTADLPTTCAGACTTTTTLTTTTASDTTTGRDPMSFTSLAPLPVPGALDLATVRLDSDASDDLAISSSTESLLNYVFGGDLFTLQTFPAEKSFPLLAVDVDGDDVRDDLVLGYYTSPSSLHLLRNSSDATFEDFSSPLPMQCIRPLSIGAADLNLDALPDYIVTCAEDPSNVYYVAGDPMLGLQAAITFDLGVRPTFVHLLDVLADPQPDLVAPYLETGDVFVFAGAGNGAFVKDGPLSFDLPGAAGTDLGLIDEDDLLDVAVSRLMTDQCSILLHLPEVGLAQPSSFACGPEVRDLALGDFDGDGLADLATIHLDQKLRVHLNVGDGSFTDPLLLDIGPSAWRVTVGDYNGDDLLDIAASTLDEVYLFLQD